MVSFAGLNLEDFDTKFKIRVGQALSGPQDENVIKNQYCALKIHQRKRMRNFNLMILCYFGHKLLFLISF